MGRFTEKLARLTAPQPTLQTVHAEAFARGVVERTSGTSSVGGTSGVEGASADGGATSTAHPLDGVAKAAPPEGARLPGRAATIDELRDRIANILARHVPGAGRMTHAAEVDGVDELPFVTEERAVLPSSRRTDARAPVVAAGADPPGSRVERAPLHLARKRAPLGARVGIAPLADAAFADPAALALLALDPALADCDPRRALYLDVESTGLSGGAGNVPFLIGLASFDARPGTEGEGVLVLEQLFLRKLGEESPMLSYLRDRIDDASMIVTFNGKSFDLPLLRARAVLSRVGRFADRPHLDLLPVARRLHAHRLPSCTLKAVERDVLGLERIGDVCGADIGAIYGHYLRTGRESGLAAVVEHNALDVFSMAALVGFYGEPIARYGGEPLPEPQHESPASTVTPPSSVPPPVLARHPDDVGALARVLRRAGRLDDAARAAGLAVAHGGGAVSLRARAEIAHARGDKAAALADYETVANEADDPAVRLRLAKLYEHHARDFAKALAVVAEGTTEHGPRSERRRERLLTKLTRQRPSSPTDAETGGCTRRSPVRRPQLPGADAGDGVASTSRKPRNSSAS